MTVSNQQVRVSYSGDGTSTIFAIPWPFYLDTDITVFLGNAPQPNGYSITGGEDANGNPQTGNVIFASAPASGVIAQFILDVPLTQLVELVDGTSFPSSTLNQVNDRAVQALLRVQDILSRSIVAPDGDILPGMSLPAAAARAGLFLSFDGAGNVLLASAGPGTQNTQATLGPILNPRTNAEQTAGVTPVNYTYGPDHVGADIRRYGNVDLSGTSDCRTILNTANSVGSALYLPRGIYRISSNLTFSVPLLFEYGAILKPDANVTVTINAPIWAGPWQIFNVSNTNALITGLIRPMTHGARIPVEWMGAVGDNITDDKNAFAATAALAKAAGNIGIQLQAKSYFITGTIYGNGSGAAGQSFYSPSWFGIEKRQTYIQLRGAALGTPALLFQGGSGQLCGATVQDIGFKGDSNSVGISFEGQCGMRAIRCLFDNNATGVRFYNNQTGSFTEYCVADQCEFTALCVTDVQYVRNSGQPSCNGSGVMQCLSNKSGGQSILIGAGVTAYNAPLDMQIWNNGATTLVNNGSSINIWFKGNLTFETLSGVLTLGTTNPVFFMGSISGDNELVTGGTFIQCEAFQSNLSGAACALGIRKAYKKTGASGANALTSSVPGSTKIIDVQATDTNYDWRGTFVITHNGTGAAGYVYAIGTTLVNNTAGFGAPSASTNSSGDLVLSNASYSGTTTIRWAEKEVGFGIINGAVATF